MKRVLVACEFSGTVRDAFARKGNHIQGDVLPHLAGDWGAGRSRYPAKSPVNQGVKKFLKIPTICTCIRLAR